MNSSKKFGGSSHKILKIRIVILIILMLIIILIIIMKIVRIIFNRNLLMKSMFKLSNRLLLEMKSNFKQVHLIYFIN